MIFSRSAASTLHRYEAMSVGEVFGEGVQVPFDEMTEAVDGQLAAVAHGGHGFPGVPGVAKELRAVADPQAIGFVGNRPHAG